MAQANIDRYKDNVRRTLGDLYWQQFTGEDKTVIKLALQDLQVEIKEAVPNLLVLVIAPSMILGVLIETVDGIGDETT